jgi:hypothetical protein
LFYAGNNYFPGVGQRIAALLPGNCHFSRLICRVFSLYCPSFGSLFPQPFRALAKSPPSFANCENLFCYKSRKTLLEDASLKQGFAKGCFSSHEKE